MSDQPMVLIVDDSGYARRKVRGYLESKGFSAFAEAADGDEALAEFRKVKPTLVIMDQVMRGRPGTETAKLMLAEDSETCVVMLTVVSDPGIHQAAKDAGILNVIMKTDWEALDAVLAKL